MSLFQKKNKDIPRISLEQSVPVLRCSICAGLLRAEKSTYADTPPWERLMCSFVFLKQMRRWTAFVLGIAIVGLEAGMIFMYKVGWNVNTGYIVKSIILAIMLIIVGYLLYKEPIKATKIIGVAVCLAGLFLINK